MRSTKQLITAITFLLIGFTSEAQVSSKPESIPSFSLTNVFEIMPSETNKNIFTVFSDTGTNLTVTNENGIVVKTILLSETNNFQYEFKDLAQGLYFISGTNYKGTLKDKIAVDAGR